MRAPFGKAVVSRLAGGCERTRCQLRCRAKESTVVSERESTSLNSADGALEWQRRVGWLCWALSGRAGNTGNRRSKQSEESAPNDGAESTPDKIACFLMAAWRRASRWTFGTGDQERTERHKGVAKLAN